MSELSEKPARKPRSLDDEIAKAAAKLKRLQDEQREQIRKDRERNQKAVLELLRSEGLDEIAAARWKEKIDAIKRALGVKPQEPEVSKPRPQGEPTGATAA
ncbi:hypothetical protein DF112_23480 [Burkholderia stagnalis]|uniref:hypothetical protein n=1 Tax=Burkholderia stagnalis TaxID=1503054 RepID=UPI000F5ED43E|nr:hypothetical protein [Burkholderia stagnalis]RQX95022.1 hypothetical protein DF119_22865 [Burkholderia stagnalis]RQY32575.1 hypothetical protein DF116_27120 [Burkholderia stagnalis]RQY49643.1 hypothetical protein DF112_23480 [Burkholderia stagnalis]RQY56555.1 hypothetical protein DF111_12095 [Burkholderia stagnalis]RQY86326.1 hypothetical protein DF108_11910 [Burkholderia stagnalis]